MNPFHFLSPGRLGIAVLLGVPLGLGLFTFQYAEGLSYFSKDPRACVNCHIMRDEYDSWAKSGHHHVAGCVDCHLPHDLVAKYVAKAMNGYHHSKGFTLQDFHEPILIKPRNADILQASCVRCHGDFVHDTLAVGEIRCVHCHKGVGHGARN